jgi:hypothetical protein
MAEPKTRPTDVSVEEFIAAIADDRRRDDVMAVDELMRSVSGHAAAMWGSSIIGYGSTTSKGQQAPWPQIAFAARKSEIVLYLSSEIEPTMFDTLGKHRRGVGCLYIKRLSEVDLDTLRRLLTRSVELGGS